MTKQANFNGTNVNIIAVNGGWTQIQLPDGKEMKVRNGALAPVVAAPQVAAPTTTPKEAKMTATAATPAATAAKPVPPVREARPAHFVGEVAPGRVAKIASTAFNLDKYFVSDVKTPTGRRTIDCADDVATALRGADIDAVYLNAAQTLGTSVDELRTQYGHLNIGMQRMNLGNRIRGAAAAKTKAEAKEAAAKVRAEAAEARKVEKAKADEEKAAAAAARKEEAAKAKAAKAEKATAKAE